MKYFTFFTCQYDFDSYGIQIMVQYRKDAKLQTLDKYIQSGGERAVAIAIYSLSLQHVTNVPFRYNVNIYCIVLFLYS